MSLRRLLQLGIDFLITAILCLIPIGLTGWLLPTNPDGTVRPLPALIGVGMALLTCVALGGLYWVALPSSSVDRLLGGQGRTAGMRVFGLRVVSEDGSRPDVGQFFVRWAGLLIDGIAFGLVGLVSIWVTKRGQRIGDLAAGTVVVSQPRHVTMPHVPDHLPALSLLPWRREHRDGAEDSASESTHHGSETVAPAPQWSSPTRSALLSTPPEEVPAAEEPASPVVGGDRTGDVRDEASAVADEDRVPTRNRAVVSADDAQDDWAADSAEDDQTPETPDDDLPPDSADVGEPTETSGRPAATSARPLPRSTSSRTQRRRRR